MSSLIVRAHIAIIVLLLGCWAVSIARGIPMTFFLRDPAAIMDTNSLMGFISNIGVLLWCSTAAICFFSVFVLKASRKADVVSFFLYAGILTALLLADDLFMFHEQVFLYYFHIPEKLWYLLYAVLCYKLCWSCRQVIFRTKYVVLIFAMAFLGVSVGIDILFEFAVAGAVVEDILKIFGIVTWFCYFSNTAVEEVRPFVSRNL